MGGSVTKEGEFAKTSVSTSRTSVSNISTDAICAKVIKRTRTQVEGQAVETVKCEYRLAPGERASGDNDFDITDAAKIQENEGIDYYIRIYSTDGKEIEVFQIVYDGTYRHFPVIRLLGSAEIAPESALGAGIRGIMTKFGEQGMTKAKLEELKLELIAALQAADELEVAGGDAGGRTVETFCKTMDDAPCVADNAPVFYQKVASADAIDDSQDKEEPGVVEESTGSSCLVRQPEDWWNEASTATLGLPSLTRLMDTRIFTKPSKNPTPWAIGQSGALYEEMGMRDPAKSYVAVWMLLGNAAILTVSEVVDAALLGQILEGGEEACLDSRFKLVISAVEGSNSLKKMLPASARDPQEADFVKGFLGKNGSCIHRAKTPAGADHVCLMVDFNCAGKLISWALRRVGFVKGHVLDLYVVDWVGKAIFASGRLGPINDMVVQQI